MPIEFVEHVATLLELCDLSSLRMTRRELEQKASQGCSISHCHHRRVELTPESLKKLVTATKHVPQVRFLEACCIIGTISTRPTMVLICPSDHPRPVWASIEDTLKDTKKLLDLLSEAFGNIVESCPVDDGLLGLYLRVILPESVKQILEPNQKYILVRDLTETTFDITMKALKRNPLLDLKFLDVFDSMNSWCSLNYDVFLNTMTRTDALGNTSFGSLRNLVQLRARLSAPQS